MPAVQANQTSFVGAVQPNAASSTVHVGRSGLAVIPVVSNGFAPSTATSASAHSSPGVDTEQSHEEQSYPA